MSNRKKIFLGLLSLSTIVATPMIILTSCSQKPTNKKHEIKKKEQQHKSENGSKNTSDTKKNQDTVKDNPKDLVPKPSKQIKEWVIDENEVNMVALGDSIASGYTQLDKQDHRGYLHSDGSISGISYSSYLAREFQAKNKLKDFNNFAIAGATTKTLRKQFDESYKLDAAGKQTQKATKWKVESQPGEKERFKNLIKKVKKANFITISIGANDILSTIKLGGLSINQILKYGFGNFTVKDGINSFVSYDTHKLQIANKVAKNNLRETVKIIKKINPNAQISIIGYPMPVTQLASLLKIPEDSQGRSIANFLLKTVDNIGLSVAKEDAKIDFIDGYLPHIWDKKALTLAPELIDIHPGPRGYRYMAATILANFSNDNDFLNSKNNVSFIPTLLEHLRLKEDYTNSIKNLSNINSPLLEEGKYLQVFKKPYKLIHYTAILLPRLIEQLIPKNIFNTAFMAAPVVTNKQNYPSKGLPLVKILKLIPFVEQVLNSGEAGLNNNNTKINEGVKKDTLFILASLYNSMRQLLGSGAQLKHLILNKQLNNPNLQKMKLFIEQNWMTKIINDVERDKIVKDGPSSNYLNF